MSTTNQPARPLDTVYTQKQINTMKATLQERFGLQLVINRINNTELYIMCQNNSNKMCTFFCMFMKKNGDPKQKEFKLVVDNPIHTPECTSTKTSQSTQSSISQSQDNLAKWPSASKQVKIERAEDSYQEMNIEDSEGNNDRIPKRQINKKKREHTIQNFNQNKSKDENQPLKALYLQNEISSLKKILVHRYQALLSKSTHIDPDTNIITRITFRCKNAQKYDCNFHQRLIVISNTAPLVYKLDSISSQHREQCLMDPQQLRYNQITKVIDKSTQILEKIIRQSMKSACNANGGGKPKQILQSLARQLGEQSCDFIYKGLQMKTYRRAIKKYFDNAVGKIRSKIKMQIVAL